MKCRRLGSHTPLLRQELDFNSLFLISLVRGTKKGYPSKVHLPPTERRKGSPKETATNASGSSRKARSCENVPTSEING